MKSRNAAFFAIVSLRVQVLFPRCGAAEFIATRESTAREEIVDLLALPTGGTRNFYQVIRFIRRWLEATR